MLLESAKLIEAVALIDFFITFVNQIYDLLVTLFHESIFLKEAVVLIKDLIRLVQSSRLALASDDSLGMVELLLRLVQHGLDEVSGQGVELEVLCDALDEQNTWETPGSAQVLK